ncbi:PEP-CTERM sorting domain-containing protein [Rugamonas sp. FT107W]|uniref:PEP-CTERM sorting domain-containing protein n=1 Tax=Duganella vulcania TaxID=2692166 RepID=A0A845HQN1_9BURK|nr:PEP-CTERM sorting domain-containing protein [Duganella vulcania]MYN19729.1 PEP-CTERM sorting domain-containing protein [Duganella vulcania]
MKTFLRIVGILLAALLFQQQALAITIGLAPLTGQKFTPPADVFFDVKIFGLQSGGTDTVLGAFSMDLHYDPTLFSFLALPPAGWGTGLGSVSLGQAVGHLDASTPGLIHVSEVSLLDAASSCGAFCTDPLLDDLQGNSFRLLTVGLYAFNTAYTSSTTTVSADNFVLADGAGDRLSPVNGRALLTFQVPEPSTPALLAIGVLGALLVRRRAADLHSYRQM